MNFAAEPEQTIIYLKISTQDISKTSVQLLFEIGSDNVYKMMHASVIAFNMSNLKGIYF